MPLTLGQAAIQAGRSKPTILKALKTGRLSGAKVGNEWQIEPSELFRVYPKTITVNANALPLVNPPENAIENAVLRARLEAAEKRIDAAQEQIQDLKEERDQWRQTATRLLAAPPQGQQNISDPTARGFFSSLFRRR